MNGKKILFLHIPKTAGQSVHAALVDSFGKEAVSPTRVQEQLNGCSMRELRHYKVFSGHLDWSMLDFLRPDVYSFTVLRRPIDRILSFYFFLRDQGQNLPPEKRSNPENQGLKAAYELSPDEYFCGAANGLRSFIDEHFDNFYTYYFAGRRQDARRFLLTRLRSGSLSSEQLLNVAYDNLKEVDRVFDVSDMSAVFDFVRQLGGQSAKAAPKEYRVNVNSAGSRSPKTQQLADLGATEKVFKRLQEYCKFDDELYGMAQRSIIHTS